VKNMQTCLFEGPPLGNFCFKNLTPFEKLRSSGKEEGRSGGGIMNIASKTYLPQTI